MNCPKCGQALPEDSDFCQYCGCKLVGASVPAGNAAPASAPELAGKTCPFCKAPFMEGEAVVFCSHCEMPHHLECWKENGGCTTFGCTGNIGRIIGAEQKNAQSAPVATRKPAEAPKTIPYPQTRTSEEAPRQVERSAPAAPARPAPALGETVLAENTDKVLQGGLPILLEKTTLRKDSDGRITVACSFRSLADKTIQAMQIDVKCADIWRESVEGVEGHQYLDLMISRDGVFGEEESISIPDSNTRVVNVLVQKIMFSDGMLLQREGDNVKLPDLISLTNMLGEELFEEYKNQTYQNAVFEPIRIGAFWRCTCGAYNREEEGDCHFCGDSLATLTSHLNKGMLQSSVDEKKRLQQEKEERERIAREEALRLKREREERERIAREEMLRIQRERDIAEAAERQRIEQERAKAEAEEARIRADKKKKRTKRLLLVSVMATACIVITYLIGWQIIPFIKYKKAGEAYASGNLELAYSQYLSIPNYKDSQNRANEVHYIQANDALAEKEYDTAYQYFSDIAGYKDSAVMAKEALFQKAESLFEAGAFGEAEIIFLQIKGYKTSSHQAAICKDAQDYFVAIELIENKRYQEAAELLDGNSYENGRDKAKEAYYLYAKELISQNKLHDAYLVLFQKVNRRNGSYEDSVELARKIEYQYALECFEAGDYKEASLSFRNAGTYEDAEQRCEESKYYYGMQLMAEADYEAAVKAFSTLTAPFKDSAKQLKESQYQYALQLLKDKDYEEAKKLFEELGTYSDSAKQIKETQYQHAVSLVKDKKYTQAVPIFKELGNYEDSIEQWKSAMWSYVLQHKNNDDKTTYEYLSALKRYNYKDSKKYYDDLYTWRATIRFYTSASSTTPVNSVPYYQRYFRIVYTITGGTPGEKIDIREYSTWPGWYCDEMRYNVSDGRKIDSYFDDLEATGRGTFTIKLYNKTNGGIIATATIKLT